MAVVEASEALNISGWLAFHPASIAILHLMVVVASFSYQSVLAATTWWVTGDKTGALDAPLILSVSIILVCVVYGVLRALFRGVSAALFVSREKGVAPVKDIDVSFAWWDVACHSIRLTGASNVKTIFYANVLSALLYFGLFLRFSEWALPQDIYVRARRRRRAPTTLLHFLHFFL